MGSFLGMSFSFACVCRQIRSSELLTVKGDLSDAHRRKRLAMSKDLLVLLLAFEVEDQDLVRASRIHYFAAYHRSLAGADVTFLAGNGEHVVELNRFALAFGQLLYFHYISRSNPILLSPGANHRVHNSLHCPCKR